MENIVKVQEQLPEEIKEVKKLIEEKISDNGKVNITKISGQNNEMNLYEFSVSKGQYNAFSAAKPSEQFNEYRLKNILVQHPEDRKVLSALSQKEPNHASAIEIKALTVALPGWKLLNDKKGKVADFLKEPNLDFTETIDDIVYKLQRDLEVFDDAYLEILKVGDAIDEMSLYHVNARDIYIEPKKRTNGSLIPGVAKKYHQIFDIMNTFSSSVFYPVRRDTELKPGYHYMVNLKGYTSRSSYYGLPCYLSAVGSIFENIVIKKYIYSFFDNNASPAIAILITGADVTEANRKAIEEHILKMKGTEKAHSLLVLSIPEPGSEIKIEELQKGLDAHFLKEREMNRTEILQSHIVPPKLLGISGIGSLGSGSEMIGAMKEFLEIVVIPKQNRLETLLNKVLKKMFGFNPEFRFLKYNITNEKDAAIIYNVLSKIIDKEGNPVMTVQEIREKYELPRAPDGNKMSVSFNGSKDTTRAVVDNEDTDASGHKMQDVNIDMNEGK